MTERNQWPIKWGLVPPTCCSVSGVCWWQEAIFPRSSVHIVPSVPFPIIRSRNSPLSHYNGRSGSPYTYRQHNKISPTAAVLKLLKSLSVPETHPWLPVLKLNFCAVTYSRDQGLWVYPGSPCCSVACPAPAQSDSPSNEFPLHPSEWRRLWKKGSQVLSAVDGALLSWQTEETVFVSRCPERRKQAAKNRGHFPHHSFPFANYFQPEEFPKPGVVCLLGNPQQMSLSSTCLIFDWIHAGFLYTQHPFTRHLTELLLTVKEPSPFGSFKSLPSFDVSSFLYRKTVNNQAIITLSMLDMILWNSCMISPFSCFISLLRCFMLSSHWWNSLHML